MRYSTSLVLAAVLPGALGGTCLAPTPEPAVRPLPPSAVQPLAPGAAERARSLVERRCAVCHGCYDAPCQLVLASRAGLERGASKARVYHASRLRAAPPTRLELDAQTPAEWRELGFFPVAEPGNQDTANLVLAMLELGRSHTFAPDEPLPEELGLALDRPLTCPSADELEGYAAEHPTGGMPYGMARLTEGEFATLSAWASAAGATTRQPLSDVLTTEIAAWESLLNRSDLKHRVTARYAFEHWVFAHLYFASHPEGPFFEIVRSATAPGAPIEVIPTRFPFDDPGVERFWYRLRRIEGAILHKTHITYELGPERRARYAELFLGDNWEPTRFPSWDPEAASNPFIAFEEIPARARYQFLLDDALYFVRTFIRGPVCRGQAATDVIRDRFFVMFLDPDFDLSVADPAFLGAVKGDLRLPAEAGANLSLFASWARYDRSQKAYRDARAIGYRKLLAGGGTRLEFIWDGDGHRRDAMLTVFRNFDNATVVPGFVGRFPETAWVMDYPVFERIYYDLVAGFDVFGNVGHQLGVRLYMDNLRMESEDLFLAFLPESVREATRARWYEGATYQLKYVVVNKMRSHGVPADIPYHSSDPRRELLELLLARQPEVAGPPDLLNRCGAPSCDRPSASALERRTERALRRLSAAEGRFAEHLPEIALLRVTGAGGSAAVYTLVHDAAHTNVAAIFREEARRKPDEDRVTVVRGILGSYPNFAFAVPGEEIDAFVDALLAQERRSDLRAIATRWGVRRTSPRFWATMDWFRDALERENQLEAGILDLNRYQNL